MAAFLRKYATGTGADLYIPIVKRAVVDFAVSADWTPASGDVKVSKDGAAAANIGTLPTAVTMGNTAMWKFVFTDSELTCAFLSVTVADSATKAVEDTMFVIETYGNASAQHAFDLDTATQSVNVTQFGGSAGTFSGGRPEVNTTHAAGTAWGSGAITAASIATGAIDADALAADTITAAKIASDAITAAKLAADCITAAKIADGAIDSGAFATGAITAAAIAADAITGAKVASDVTIASVTGAVGSVTGNVGGNVAGSVGSVTGNVGGNVTGSVGSVATGGITRASLAADTGLQSMRSNTAQGGTASTITLDASAPAVDIFNTCYVYLTGGTGAGQCRLVTAYDTGTKVMSVSPNWETTPDNTSTFAIFGGADVDVHLWKGALAGALNSGRVDVYVGAVGTGVIDSAAFAAGAINNTVMSIDGSELTAIPWNAAWDAEVQSEVQDAIEVNHLDHLLAATYDPASKPGAADALLNELVGDDGGVSQFTANALELAPTGGSAPTAAQIADAVWDEATSGHTTSGTFGEQLKTDVDAILADTNELQTDWADGGRLDLLLDAVLADTGTDGVAVSAATANQIADALLDRTAGVETNRTPRQALRLILAALVGKLSGAATTTVTIRDTNDGVNRVVATVDADGNRSAVTLDAS